MLRVMVLPFRFTDSSYNYTSASSFWFLLHTMVKESIRKRQFKSLFPFPSSPNLGVRHVERAIAESVVVIFVCPYRFACTFHMLENALHKVVGEQFVEGPSNWILDVV